MGKRSREDEETLDEPVREPTDERPPSDEVHPEVEPHTDEHVDEPHEEGEGDGRRARVMRFAKRLMDRRELSHDTREILGSVLATSDKAKNEAVRIAARELRSYLDALELKEDFKELITSYSLEISLSLKPLSHAVAAAESALDRVADGEPGKD